MRTPSPRDAMHGASPLAQKVKNLPAMLGLGSISGSGSSPGEGNGYPLQYSCLGNPIDTGAWRATVHSVTKSQKRQTDSYTHTTLGIIRFESTETKRRSPGCDNTVIWLHGIS